MKSTRLAERRRAKRVLDAYACGLTDPEKLSRRTGLGPAAIRKILHKAGIDEKPITTKGDGE